MKQYYAKVFSRVKDNVLFYCLPEHLTLLQCLLCTSILYPRLPVAISQRTRSWIPPLHERLQAVHLPHIPITNEASWR